MESPHMVTCEALPDEPDLHRAYRLTPKHADDEFYRERTDRNIGWITRAEQDILKRSVVGVAGCGGMGGLIASVLLRLGIGEIRIADCEGFDISNINRQFAAMRGTVGSSKAIETAKLLRAISDDTTLVVYPQGIIEETVDEFVTGCDLICDMIEFWAIANRILLHQFIRDRQITLLNCDTVGHRTHLFRFDHESAHLETALGFDYDEARVLQEKIRSKQATPDEIARLMDAVLKVFVPETPEYFAGATTETGTAPALRRRLFDEGKASIIATNPPMATGFICNHVLFQLLRNSGTNRQFVEPPRMPGYLAFDAATMATFHRTTVWW